MAENVSSHGVEFELPDRCPNGALDFEGLPAGFDYYGTCNVGACAGSRLPLRVSLDPGGRRQVALAVVETTGSTCTASLPAGYYQVRPVLPPMPFAACVDANGLDLRRQALQPVAPQPVVRPEPSRPRRLTPAPPQAPPVALDPTYGCTTAADCVLSCPSPTGCCGWTCGCTNAIRRDHVEAFGASYAKTCTRPPHCLAVDCGYRMAVGATCRNGRCAAATGPDEMR